MTLYSVYSEAQAEVYGIVKQIARDVRHEIGYLCEICEMFSGIQSSHAGR